MKKSTGSPKILIYLLAARPKFLTASAAPVIVGSALGFAQTQTPQPYLFVIALLAIMAIHAGANIANDYFDHISRNDWLNKNPTPFSGGRRFIQNQILSPRKTLAAAIVCFTVGAALGLVIIALTKSLFILALGLIGLLGGFFYTAPPLKLGYRCAGELAIALLFGILPVYASYYLQTNELGFLPLVPAAIVAALIFLVILINEFPDKSADAAVAKKTLVVSLGISRAALIYKITLASTYATAAAALIVSPTMFYACLFYLLTLPLAFASIKAAKPDLLAKSAYYRPSELTILLHAVGSLTLTAGFIITALH